MSDEPREYVMSLPAGPTFYMIHGVEVCPECGCDAIWFTMESRIMHCSECPDVWKMSQAFFDFWTVVCEESRSESESPKGGSGGTVIPPARVLGQEGLTSND